MDTYTKTRKLQQELIAARATDGDLDDAITAAEATAFADITGKPGSLSQFYYQPAAPSHSTVACVESTVSNGDYWIDSDDNKLYKSDGTQWVEIQDFSGDISAVQSLIDDIADDAKITAVEKLTLKPVWDAIVTEATLTTGTLVVQAALFSVADADFDAAYLTLYTYLISTLNVFNSMSATTTIDRTTWDNAWNAYWDERTNLINDIEVAAKDLADAAQADATAAKDLTDLGFDANGNLITSVLPASNVVPDGAGLYIGNDYLGYYGSGVWTSYLDNSGNFYLGGTSGALQWNGTTLSLVGSINITGTSTVGQLIQIDAGGSIRSNTTGNYPYLEFSNNGLQLKDADDGGTVGTAEEGTDIVGAGATVWLMNDHYQIPWMEMKEPVDDSANDMPSIRFYDRAADPAGGSYTQGDICCVNGVLRIYKTAGGWSNV